MCEVKPVNQLLSLKSDISSKLSDILTKVEYLILINLIKSLNLLFLGVRSLPLIKLHK